MALFVVTATRLRQVDFLDQSLLGRSLSGVSQLTPLGLRGFFENARPLGDCYNEVIDQAGGDDVLLFVHDDVYLNDWMLGWRVQEALLHFDVVGVVGNRRRQPGQETWYMQPSQMVNGVRTMTTFDSAYLSGAIAHGSPESWQLSNYGPVPQPVQLIDGVFMAAKAGRLKETGVRFDPALGFHLYDLDFCRSALKAGLSIGTWPMAITHASIGGSVQSNAWAESAAKYLAKWGD